MILFQCQAQLEIPVTEDLQFTRSVVESIAPKARQRPPLFKPRIPQYRLQVPGLFGTLVNDRVKILVTVKLSVCVTMSVCLCVYVCVSVFLCACVRACVRACVHACLNEPARHCMSKNIPFLYQMNLCTGLNEHIPLMSWALVIWCRLIAVPGVPRLPVTTSR